ncbi:Glycosyltransferase involved in cell wall biosynthesis [Candidatus Fervidibacteria bacterium JGI MDM2 JNZ-1-D12]
MRILKVTQAYAPFLDKGGPAVKVPAIAKRLVQRGHSVTVLTANYGAVGDGQIKACEWDGVRIVYLRTIVRYRAITLNPGIVTFCLQHLRAFDLVHIYGLYDLLGPTVAFFCRRFGIPYVVEPMGMFRPIVRNIRLKYLYHRLLGWRMVNGAARLIATSEREKGELIEDGIPAEKVFLRRNGVEAPEQLPEIGSFRKHWGIPPDVKLVLFLGRLVAKKSPDMLIESFAEILKAKGGKASNVLLVLAGPEEGDGYLKYLRSLALQLGVKDNILFTGPLYGDAKWAAYRDADVFVLPSQSENFGNTVAEAIMVGTPVIVTDRCGIAPYVDGRVGLVVPYDRKALSNALQTILTDEQLAERFRRNCTQVAKEFSWDEPVTEMETLYRQLVVRGGLS